MAYSVASLMNSTVSNPEVAAVGLLVGFLMAKALDWRKRRSGLGGGGFP